MTEIWFLRHGETDWNAARRIQGQRDDSRLTPRGHAQARAAAALLAHALGDKAATIPVFASPLTRARQTLAHVLSALGRPESAARFDSRLMERSFGVWEGEPAARMHAGIGFDAAAEPERYFHWRPDGGESLADVCARVESFLNDLSGPAVIVAHGGTFRALSHLVCGVPAAQAARMKVSQKGICHLRNGKARWLFPAEGEGDGAAGVI